MSVSKRFSFLIGFILPVFAVISAKLGGLYYLLIPITLFVVLPLLDLLVGKDPNNPSEENFLNLQNEKYFRYLTYVWAFVQVALVIWAVNEVAIHPKPLFEFLLFALSIGLISSGIGITVAHELGHKSTRLEQFLSKMIYMTVCYMHFFIEHNRGHHSNVSTFEDPATSRKGESFYQFYPRTIFGSLRSAWMLETKRLSKLNLPAFHYRNEMLWYGVITFSFASFLFGMSSLFSGNLAWSALGFFFLQSIVAISLLELVNYIEHYGLTRKEIAPGKFEKVLPIHSWNQNFSVSNAFLFHLQRHSDHHANAGRRYQVLRHYEEAPQLPFGYEVMVLIALFPPLWFKILNPRLEQWEMKNLRTQS